MDLKNYRAKLIGSDNERAVSPVIGVILMVAITVILAAVIAAFVLDMGDMGGSAPQAQYEWTNSSSGIIVEHTSAETIDTGNLGVQVSTDSTTETAELGSKEFTAGDTIKLVPSSGDISEVTNVDSSTTSLSGTVAHKDVVEVTIVWQGDGTSSEIASTEL